MDQIKISKTKLRRGTNDQRKAVILDQGEIVYTLDTNRLYIGNGVLSGGVSPTSRVHPILSTLQSLTALNAEVNDLANVNGLFYQLSGNDPSQLASWAAVGVKPGPQLQFDASSQLVIKTASISASNLDPVTVGLGLKINAGILQTDYNTKSLNVSANKLEVKAAGITEYEISSTTFGNGLSGGSNGKVGVLIDPTQFYFNGGLLSLSAIPSNSLTFASINSSWIGNGLVYDNVAQKIRAIVTDVDNVTLTKNVSGVAGIAPGVLAPTIFDVLTGKATGNTNNSLSSIFNGNPQHTITGAIPGLTITKFTAISTNGLTTQTLELSSAGFITYQGGITTQTGQQVGRFAIPIFAY